MVRRIVAASFVLCCALAGCDLGPPKPPRAEAACASGSLAECEAVCKAGDASGCQAFGARICKEGSTLECTAACDTDNFVACTALAGMYRSGDRVPSDDTMYYAIMDRICTQGDRDACRTLGEHYSFGSTSGDNWKELASRYFKQLCVEKDLYKTPDKIIWRECTGSRRACIEQKYKPIRENEADCTKLAELDPPSVDMFVRACDRGELAACSVLVGSLKSQIQDERRAVYLEALRKLCQHVTSEGNHDSDVCGRLKDAALPHA